jgi:flagellar basal-body rod protein FlgC
MSLFTVFQIASQGMSAQRERLEAASANLANSNTTRTAEGGPYRRRDVIFETQTVEEPLRTIGASSESLFGSVLDSVKTPTESVKSTVATAPADQVVKRYLPNHPDADADGYVAFPDVDPLEETVNMMSAARSFEANATAFNIAKELMRASLNLGDA